MKALASRAGLGLIAVAAIALAATSTTMTSGSERPQPPATILIETENLVIYRFDTFDATLLGTQSTATMALPLRPFMQVVWLADIVAVNGTPAQGTLAVRGQQIQSPTNTILSDWFFDIRRVDGSPVGTIVASGWAFGARPAGFDSLLGGNLAVTGGTGAFLGVRGEGGEAGRTADVRFASVVESPTVRRTLGGGARQFAFRLIPAGRLSLD